MLALDKRKRLKIPEANIEAAITSILEYDGWRSFKMEQNFSEKKQRAFGEAGMPDRLYIRHLAAWMQAPRITDRALCEVLWIEHKAATGKASAAQKLWHAAERKRGALTLIAGEDFEASVDGFLEFYRKSGLMRRV